MIWCLQTQTQRSRILKTCMIQQNTIWIMLITTDGVRGLRRSFGIKKYKLNKKRSSINFEERFLLYELFFSP